MFRHYNLLGGHNPSPSTWRPQTSKWECQSYKQLELWDSVSLTPLHAPQSQIQGRLLTDVYGHIISGKLYILGSQRKQGRKKWAAQKIGPAHIWIGPQDGLKTHRWASQCLKTKRTCLKSLIKDVLKHRSHVTTMSAEASLFRWCQPQHSHSLLAFWPEAINVS